MTTVEDTRGLLDEASPRRADWNSITWEVIAVIAMITYRIIAAWSDRKKHELGLAWREGIGGQ